MNDINEYLDHIFDVIDPNIRLDDEQKSAVVGEDNHALVVAGAGTGKTTTIAAKVKYLVEVKHIDPSRILVMSYTRKAVEELRRRINVDFNIPACVTTFHSLGLRYLRLINSDKKVITIDENERYEYFLDYLENNIFPYREKLDELVRIFNDQQINWLDPRCRTYGQYFLEHYQEYSNFDDYLEAYVNQKIRETQDIVTRVSDMADRKINGERPTTIKGERVKSKGEAIIANYLFCNGIDYSYERVYDELVGEQQIYRPDFSIDVGGERIYIEYFGMSGSNLDNRSYQIIRRRKEDYHREKHNKFIALDYLPNRGYLKVLERELKALGLKLHPKPIEEIYRILLINNPLYEFRYLRGFIYDIIDTIKTSEQIESFDDYLNQCNNIINQCKYPEEREIKTLQLRWLKEYWNYYNTRKMSDPSKLIVDYADMIKAPLGHIEEVIPDRLNFNYVIVDEYQDISAARFNLLQETLECSQAKFFAIGDDWQSIFAFQGAKVGYILNFDTYFPNAKRYIISRTYRNAQSLIDAAGKFVMRNRMQIKKDLKSNKDIYQPICFVKIKKQFLIGKHTIADRNRTIEEMIREIHHSHPKDTVCVIGRTNSILDSLFEQSNFVDSAENKVRIKGVDDFYFDALTIHKSKGLTYDWTIIMPLTKYFPSEAKKVFWLLDIVRNEPEEEAISYAEQRRLFYVALTRTKNRVYILYPDKGEHSRYKDELWKIIHELKEMFEQQAR